MWELVGTLIQFFIDYLQNSSIYFFINIKLKTINENKDLWSQENHIIFKYKIKYKEFFGVKLII